MDLPTYFCHAVCTQKTQLLCLHRPHFDKYFRRKNPSTLQELQLNVSRQLELRSTYKTLAQRPPLIQAMVFRLKLLSGDFPQTFSEFDDTYSERPYSQAASLARSTITSRSFPLMNRHRHNTPRQIKQPRAYQPPLPTISKYYNPHDTGQPRDGIYMKLQHVTTPGARRVLSVSDDEFKYLTQLRRRINLEKVGPKRDEEQQELEQQEGGFQRPCRKEQRRRTAALPVLGRSSVQKGLRNNSSKARNVLFSLPHVL